MKLMRVALLTGIAVLLVAAAPAQQKKAVKKAADVVCPVCHMTLSAKKDGMHKQAVYVGKSKTEMYCCSCKMPKSLTTKPSVKKTKVTSKTAKKSSAKTPKK